MKRSTIPSIEEITKQIAVGLRRTAVRPSISGYKPQEHQVQFHSSEARGRAFIGGNRSGKTVGGGSEAVYWLSGRHPYFTKFRPPVRGRCVGVDFDNGINKIILPEIAKWTPPSLLKNGSWEDSYSRGDRILTLENGSTCEFMSYDQDIDKFSGTSRHFVWFDEEPPEAIFNECMARLIDTGGNWWLTMTPLIDMSWTYDRIYLAGKSKKDPNIAVFEVSTSENAYVNLAEMDILTGGMDDEEKNARLNGTYIGQSGTIYSKSLHADTYLDPLIDSDRWSAIHSRWGHFGMLDHGYTNPTAFYLGAFNEEGEIIIYDEYYHSYRLVRDNAIAINSRIRELKLQDKLEYIVADPSTRNTDSITGTSVQQEYGENGIYLSLGNNNVHSGILRVSGRFKNKTLRVTRNCEKLIWELGRYRWAKYSSGKVAGKNNAQEKPMKKDDHAVDAIRYGVMSRPALPGEVDERVGNVLNAPTAIGPERFDEEVRRFRNMSYADQRNESLVDFTLGDEW